MFTGEEKEVQRFKRVLLCLLAVLLPLCAMADGLHETLSCASLQVEASIGYDGLMTYGTLMPLNIRLKNLGQDMNATVAVNVYASQETYNRYEMDVALAANAEKQLCIPISVGSKQETFTVEVWQDASKICAVNVSPTQTVNPSALLVGVLSDAPEKLSYMNIDATNDELLRVEYFQTIPLTAETFPDSAELLAPFGILAVDGFDVSLLSASQRQALEQWLEAGHILLLGGGSSASASWPFFASYTGLTLDTLTLTEDITPALLQWLGAVGVPSGREVTLARATGGTALVSMDSTPLIWRSQAGDSVIYTTAFSLSDKALTGWSPMHTFWQRTFIKDCYSLYQRCLYPSSSYTGYYAYSAASLPLENDVDLLPAALLAAGVMVLGSALAYCLLRRWDKRQWLWLILPVLACASTAGICVMAANSSAAQPTVLALSILQQDKEGLTDLSTSLAVASPEQGEQLIASGNGSIRPLDETYYDYSTTSGLPTAMNYRYVLGENRSLGVDLGIPWSCKYLQMDNVPVPQGQIVTSVWMEDDGLHAALDNQTQMTLDAGVFLCKFGFCSVPALAPGESCTLALIKTATDPNDPYAFQDGCMYESLAGSSIQSYSILNQYYRQKLNLKADESLDNYTSTVFDLVAQVLDRSYWGQNYLYSSYYYDSMSTKFHYLTTTENLPALEISINGSAVTRSAHLGLVAIEVPFVNTQNSQVCYLPGECQVLRYLLDDAGVPFEADDQTSTAREYHSLKDNPAFMFQLDDPATTISHLSFHVSYMPQSARAYLYNGVDWVAYTMGEDVADPQQYLDEQGRIFLQLRSSIGTDDYQDVMTPAMLLEGSVNDHADH